MIDRRKVMTWLEICGKNNDCSGCCPYSENGFGEYGQCRESLMADAYDLLKEQEEQIKTRDESLEKAREEIKWLRGMLKEQEQRINELEEKLRLLEYGDQDTLQSGMMPAT